PDHWDARIAVHFAHRVGALVATVAILATGGHVLAHHRHRREPVRPAPLPVSLVAVPIVLGALTVLSRRGVVINSAHVVCGGLVLSTSLVTTLRSWRVRFDAPAGVGVGRSAVLGESIRPAASGVSASGARA